MTKIIDAFNLFETMQFEHNFNECVDNIPDYIKKIVFGCYFNQSVNNLPNSIITIKFGTNFNHPINNLPTSVKNIIFYQSSNFNQHIDNLPISIIFISFDIKFYQPIENLPNNINCLKLKCNYYKLINLPKSLSELIFYDVIYSNSQHFLMLNNLPISIKLLSLLYDTTYNMPVFLWNLNINNFKIINLNNSCSYIIHTRNNTNNHNKYYQAFNIYYYNHLIILLIIILILQLIKYTPVL